MPYVLLPNTGQSLGQTRADIRENFNLIQTAFNVNHVSLTSGDGKHNYIQIPTRAAIPGGLVAADATIYSKTAGAESQLFISPNASGNEYQLTRCVTGSYSKFATNAAYGTPPAGFTQTGGWTFLPGGLLFQYGFFGNPGALGASGTIQYPVTFTATPFNVVAILIRSSSASQSMSLPASLSSTSSFGFQATSSSSDGVYWQAIGA